MATSSKLDCPLCGGSGWKSVGDPGPRKAPQVTRCECRHDAHVQRLLASAHIPKRYEHCTLSDFHLDISGADRTLASARLAAGRFVEDYPVEKKGLLFIGSSGLGKTHLAVGIIRELMVQKSIRCMFCDYSDLFTEIGNTYSAGVAQTELGILKPLYETEVLVIDDLGARRPGDWVFDTISLLINKRYNQDRTTIFTSNYPDGPAGGIEINQLQLATRKETLGDRITDRMRSRLMEMCKKVEMFGADYRGGVTRGVGSPL
jgi:DNA replication protein DnaC